MVTEQRSVAWLVSHDHVPLSLVPVTTRCGGGLGRDSWRRDGACCVSGGYSRPMVSFAHTCVLELFLSALSFIRSLYSLIWVYLSLSKCSSFANSLVLGKCDPLQGVKFWFSLWLLKTCTPIFLLLLHLLNAWCFNTIRVSSAHLRGLFLLCAHGRLKLKINSSDLCE